MQSRRHIFINALLFRPDGSFAPGSLLVDGDTIADVLPAGETVTGARVVDLGGRTVIPGFVDSHIHLSSLALKRLRIDLAGAGSAADVVARLEAADADGGGAVVGVDWDESAWQNHAFPTRDLLDGVARDRPVYARRICGHVGVANTYLLSRLDPPPEFIDRESGTITESAVELANEICRPPAESFVPAIGAAAADLFRLGITGIHDIVGVREFDSYLDGIRACRAPLRVDALLITGPESFGPLAQKAAGLDGHRFRPAGIKMFSDGSFGGWTAALHSSYSDARTIGEFLLEEDELEATLRSCCDKGIPCAVHAIGDRALRAVLLAISRFPSGGDLFRIEHAELVGWDEMRLLENTRVSVAMQPNFVRNWQQPGGLYERRLGPDRWRRCNPFRTLRDNGVPCMFGSDGMPPGPLYGIGGATGHPVRSERLTLSDALLAYTEAPVSHAGFRRNSGRLSPGFLADLVVLSGDPGAGDPDRLTVEQTIAGGDVVYSRAGLTSGSAND
jgi:predicted amidohydrolase YtcJ